MKSIRIISGTYGHRRPGSRIVESKDVNSPPFDVDDAKAEKLTALGVAAYADIAPERENGDDDKPDDKPYGIDMKASELRKIMEEQGLPVASGITKADMVAALDEHFGKENGDDNDDDDDGSDDDDAVGDPPGIGAADPIA